ncbi:MAG: hypothetical protein H7327_12535 [Herminiimonas sp.]|nr:hypothetical protein [Herminiimonas sp.]
MERVTLGSTIFTAPTIISSGVATLNGQEISTFRSVDGILNSMVAQVGTDAKSVVLTDKEIQILADLKLHGSAINFSLNNGNIQDMINSGDTPEDLKQALRGLQDDANLMYLLDTVGDDGTIRDADNYVSDANVSNLVRAARPQLMLLNDDEMGIVATLQRHRDDSHFRFDNSYLQEKIDDPNTLSDEKAALEKLKNDPKLLLMFDTGATLDDSDSEISSGDVNAVGQLQQMKDYNARMAAVYVQCYVPSEGNGDATGVRPITENEAGRELYLYSDNLPEQLDLQTLKDFVANPSKGGKCPPQLTAALQFFINNPDAWSRLTAGANPTDENKLLRSDILDNISKNVYLNPDETATLDIIGKNRDTFLNGGLTRDKLQRLIDDPNTTADVKKAAAQLKKDPLLFGMLDNGRDGHLICGHKTVDDNYISREDFDAFTQHLTTKSKTPPPLPPVVVPQSESPSGTTLTTSGTIPHSAAATGMPDNSAMREALAAMNAGAADDPEEKKKKGGWDVNKHKNAFLKFFESIANIGSKILHAVSKVLEKISKIPIIGLFVAPVALALQTVASGVDVISTVIKGGDIKGALVNAANSGMKVVASSLHSASMVLSGLSKVPVIGLLATPLSIAAEVVAGGLDIASVAIEHGDIMKAIEKAGIGWAGAAIGVLLVPGAGAAILKGAQAGIARTVEATAMNVVGAATQKNVMNVAMNTATEAAGSAVVGVAAGASGAIAVRGAVVAGERAGVRVVETEVAAGAKTAGKNAKKETAGEMSEKAAENTAKKEARDDAKKEAKDDAKKKEKDDAKKKEKDDAKKKRKDKEDDTNGNSQNPNNGLMPLMLMPVLVKGTGDDVHVKGSSDVGEEDEQQGKQQGKPVGSKKGNQAVAASKTNAVMT